MKKFFFTFLFFAFSIAAISQQKIAILETVDREGNVPYGIRLQLRSNLTYAISNTPGYEGYDRVDMSQIIGEHDFQRTGMVSDEQIKKLGEMTGASSILVAEAAIYDKDNIIITAKILNVETASVERAVPPQISSINPEKMQNACVEVANKLLGQKQKVAEKPKTTGKTKEVEKPIVIERPQVDPSVERTLISKGKDFYYLDGQRITDNQYLELIKGCPEAWMNYERGVKQVQQGKKVMRIGLGTIAVGVGAALVGLVWDTKIHQGHWDNSNSHDYEYFYYAGGIIAGAGIIVTGVSFPIKMSGKSKQTNAYEFYNQYCAQPKTTLSFGPTGNGVGVCLNF